MGFPERLCGKHKMRLRARRFKGAEDRLATLPLATGLSATGLRQQVDTVDNWVRILLSLRDPPPEACYKRSEAGLSIPQLREPVVASATCCRQASCERSEAGSLILLLRTPAVASATCCRRPAASVSEAGLHVDIRSIE